MSTPIPEILDRAERLYRDLALGAVRDWKATTGGLAVGFLPIWAPRELLHSQGVLPVGLMGGGEDVEIIRGDAFYQSYICHLPRSVVELGLGGQLDVLDGVLFPAICDVIRNLSGVWMMKFPDKLVRYLDVPQDFDREVNSRCIPVRECPCQLLQRKGRIDLKHLHSSSARLLFPPGQNTCTGKAKVGELILGLPLDRLFGLFYRFIKPSGLVVRQTQADEELGRGKRIHTYRLLK